MGGNKNIDMVKIKKTMDHFKYYMQLKDLLIDGNQFTNQQLPEELSSNKNNLLLINNAAAFIGLIVEKI